MVPKKTKLKKTTAKKPTVKKVSKVEVKKVEKDLEEIMNDNNSLEEDVKEIAKVVEETKQNEEKKKNNNLFQTMKDIIWF